MRKKTVGNDKIEAPDAHLDKFIKQVTGITENWAKRHDLWHDSCHRDPLLHFNDEPGEGGPILLLCSDGPAMTALEWDNEYAQELRNELEEVGIYLELDDRVTAGYHFIDYESDLQKDFDRFAKWKWTCKLVEVDSEDVTGDVYQHFANNPNDFHRLPHRDFEKLVGSIFSARGWTTELGPGSGDGGVDLRLWQTDPLGDILTLVQIKRFSPNHPIKLEAVAALDAHVNREGANRGLFVTSSRFLPGVKKFADRQKYQLRLADGTDLQRWCEDAAQATRIAKNRALAMESIGPLIEEIRHTKIHPRLLVGGLRTPLFCVVLRETKTSALLAHIQSEVVIGDCTQGLMMPQLDGQFQTPNFGSSVFRATRSEENGRVSYWGQRELYHRWDGTPCAFDHWD